MQMEDVSFAGATCGCWLTCKVEEVNSDEGGLRNGTRWWRCLVRLGSRDLLSVAGAQRHAPYDILWGGQVKQQNARVSDWRFRQRRYDGGDVLGYGHEIQLEDVSHHVVCGRRCDWRDGEFVAESAGVVSAGVVNRGDGWAVCAGRRHDRLDGVEETQPTVGDLGRLFVGDASGGARAVDVRVAERQSVAGVVDAAIDSAATARGDGHADGVDGAW